MANKLKKKEIQDLKSKYPRIGEIKDFYQNAKTTLISVILVVTVFGIGVGTVIGEVLTNHKGFPHLLISGIIFLSVTSSFGYWLLTDMENEEINDYIKDI